MVDIAQLGLEFRSDSVRRAERDMRNFNRTGTRSEQVADRLSRSAERMGRDLGRALGLASVAVAGFTTNAVRMGVNFESALTRMNTLVGVSRSEIDQFRDSILQLAPSVGRGPQELAEAMFAITSAGARGSQAMEILEASAKAAALGLGETRSIALTAGAAVTAFGEANLSASDAVDILVGTVEQGNLEASSLSRTLGNVISIASSVGASFADVGAFVAAFTRQGVSAEQAVTGLRGTLTILAREPTAEAQKALAELGLTIDDVRASVREDGFIRAFQDLVQQAQDGGVSLARIIPEVEALSGSMAVFASQGESAVDILDKVEGAVGSLSERFRIAAEQDPALAFAMLRAEFQTISTQLGVSLLPLVGELISGLRGVDGQARLLREALTGLSDIILTITAFAIAAAQAFNQLGIRTGQLLAELGALADNTRENFDFWDAIVPGRAVFSAFDTFKDQAASAAAIGEAAGEDIAAMEISFGDLVSSVIAARNAMRKGNEEIETLEKNAKDAKKPVSDIGKAAGMSAEQMDEMDRAAKALSERVSEFRRESETLAARLSGPAATAALQFNRQQENALELLNAGGISLSEYSRAVADYAEEVRRALDPTEEIEEALMRQADAQQQAEDRFRSVKQELIDQMNLLTLTGDALYEYERGMFVAARVAELGEDATREYREEVARFSAQLFDTANAARTFAERISEALSGILPDEIADGVGRGLERGLAQGIQSIDPQDVLDGNFAEIGESLGRNVLSSVGQAVGSIGGSIGSAIGQLIGDIIGDAIFGDSVPKFQVRGVNATRAIDEGTDLSVDGPLGQIDFAFRGIEAEARATVERAFVEFDTAIASFISDADQLTQIEAALDAFGVSSRSDGEDLEGLLQLRFDAILSTFDQTTQSVVRAAAQTLDGQVQALADIQAIAVQEALGRGLGLDDALPIIAELQISGETLATTFARLRDAAALLDTTMALTGATFGATREEVLRFGQGLADAFGGDLQRANALLGTIFGTFFSEAERLEVRVEQSTARAVDLLAQIGVDATDEILSRGGFRELFDALSGTLSPEDLAILIEAGAEIAALIEAEESLAEARDDSVDAAQDAAAQQQELNALLRDVGLEALSVVAPARAEYAELARSIEANIMRAQELGASEQQLNFIRQASEIRIRGFIASLSESIASLTEQLFGAGPQVDALGGTLNVAANAAGNFRDQWLSAIDAIGNALDDQLLGPNSTLTAQERQQESLSQFQEALAAAQGGDLGAAQSLPQLFQQALAQGASFFGSTSGEFANLEAQLRSALENADLPVPPASPDVQTAQNTATTARAVQQVEQTALQQLTAATQLISQLGLLSRLTGDTPAELARQFGIPVGSLMQILTGDLPEATGAALDSEFNDLAESIGQDLNELAGLEAIEIESRDILIQIRDLLGGMDIAKPDPDDLAKPSSLATGGPIERTGMALVHQGEFVIPRDGALISGGSSMSDRILSEIRDELRLSTRQNDEQIRATRVGSRESVEALQGIRDEQRKKSTAGKPALTRA